MKQCPDCKEYKDPIEGFYQSTTSPYCKKCVCRRATESRKKDPERAKRWQQKYRDKTVPYYISDPERVKVWRKRYWEKTDKVVIRQQHNTSKHKRRCILLGLQDHHTSEDFRRICESQDGKCYYCGKEDTLTIEHKTPICRGGSNSKENIVGACLKCNVKKAKRTDAEFFSLIG